MLWLSRKDIEHISRRLLRDYLKKVPQKVDHIDPADFAEKMCGLQFTFADISEAHDAIGLTATSGVIITIPQRDGTRLDYELDGKTAFIDQSLVAENQIGRLNFTMMHEAAHQLFWMLYPEEYEVQTPRCVFRMADEHKRISDLTSQNQTLAFLKQQGLVDPDIFIAKTNELTKQLRQAKQEKEKLMDAESDMTALQTRDLIDLLKGGPEFLDSFDAELFGELVEKIIIESNDSVRFCLKNGLELRESIERTMR